MHSHWSKTCQVCVDTLKFKEINSLIGSGSNIVINLNEEVCIIIWNTSFIVYILSEALAIVIPHDSRQIRRLNNLLLT